MNDLKNSQYEVQRRFGDSDERKNSEDDPSGGGEYST